MPRKKLTVARLYVNLLMKNLSLPDREQHVQNVSRLDNQTPSGPDEAGASQGKVLSKGELLSGTGKVTDTSKNKSPLLQIELVSNYFVFF